MKPTKSKPVGNFEVWTLIFRNFMKKNWLDNIHLWVTYQYVGNNFIDIVYTYL